MSRPPRATGQPTAAWHAERDTSVMRPIDPLETVRIALLRRIEEWLLREAIAGKPQAKLAEAAQVALEAVLEQSPVPLDGDECDRVIDGALRDLAALAGQEPADEGEDDGLGPLEPLMADPKVSDILVTGPHMIFVEREGRLEEVRVRFASEEQLVRLVHRIARRAGRRMGPSQYTLDARLPDGSRVNAILSPLAVNGPVVSIRRFSRTPWTGGALMKAGMLTRDMLEFLRCAVMARLNIAISGGTGAGKTTVLNVLTGFIPEGHRLVTIEDVAEIQPNIRHVVRMETRPPDEKGHGEVTARDLLRNALRMRPDRIIIGEVRGAEVLDVLQAMNTGHEGSMTTIHANAPREALHRLFTMVGMAGAQIEEKVVQQMACNTIHAIVQVNRYPDGRRRVSSITEVCGMQGNIMMQQELFRFRQESVDDLGNVVGDFSEMLLRPFHAERMLRSGVVPDLPGF